MQGVKLHMSTNERWQFTVLVSDGHKLVHFVGILHDKRGEILYIDTDVRPLSDLQLCQGVLPQQIPHLLVIELKVGHPYQEADLCQQEVGGSSGGQTHGGMLILLLWFASIALHASPAHVSAISIPADYSSPCFIATLCDVAKDVSERVWDHSPLGRFLPLALHCVRLAGAGLAVGKDGACMRREEGC